MNHRWITAAGVPGLLLMLAAAPIASTPKPSTGPAVTAVTFVDDIAPMFRRLGCYAAACHGSADSKAGMKLLLRGADPAADYDALVKADGGRRINLAEPEKSYMLRKITVPKPGGGREKMSHDSPEYRLLLNWIKQGAPCK